MREVIKTGRTVEDATELALAELGVSAEEAGIEVLELPQRRLFKSIPAKVRAYVEEQNPQGFYPVQSDAFYLELVPQGISKGRGMRMIQQALGLTKAAAIGDRENDKPMLELADFSAVPKSGDPDLQKEVDFIVDSCENGAVADFICRLEQICTQ